MTMTKQAGTTCMAREITEIPALAGRLLARQSDICAVADRIRQMEARIGVIVSAAAPSVFTAYRRRPDMRSALFVVISQSGRSPDLVMATEYARESGALTLAIVNDEASPVAA